MLADYFDVPVEVHQFLGQWLYLAEEDQSSLPSPRCPAGLNTQLGTNVVVGERMWDVEGKFRVRLGPIGYAQFRRLTPVGRRPAAAVPDDPILRRDCNSISTSSRS